MPEVPPDFSNPVYRHLLVNHLPLIGVLSGTLALAVALLTRRAVAQIPALVLIVVMAGSAWVAFETGEAAYRPVRATVDDAGVDWLDIHLDRAHLGVWAFYATGALALAALLAPLKWPRSRPWLAAAVIAAGLLTVFIGGWIAQAGGYVSHPAIRPPLPILDDVPLPKP